MAKMTFLLMLIGITFSGSTRTTSTVQAVGTCCEKDYSCFASNTNNLPSLCFKLQLTIVLNVSRENIVFFRGWTMDSECMSFCFALLPSEVFSAKAFDILCSKVPVY